MVKNTYWTGQNIQSSELGNDHDSGFGANKNRQIATDSDSTVRNTYLTEDGLNKFGSTGRFNTNEQSLVQSMVSESININGITVKFMPRKIDNDSVDKIWNESPESYFHKGFNIDVLLESATGFEGEGATFTNYGIEFKEEVILKMSIDKFDTLDSDFRDTLEHEVDQSYFGRQRPLEGDLIAIPFGRSSNNDQYYPKVFEIMKVDTFRDGGFFQLGDNFQYRIQARLFDYSYEQLEFTPRVTKTELVFVYRDSEVELTLDSDDENLVITDSDWIYEHEGEEYVIDSDHYVRNDSDSDVVIRFNVDVYDGYRDSETVIDVTDFDSEKVEVWGDNVDFIEEAYDSETEVTHVDNPDVVIDDWDDFSFVVDDKTKDMWK